MKVVRTQFFLTMLLLTASLFAETVKDREGAVRKDHDTLQDDARWHYNDVQKGFEEAKKTGKPLLVVLRCVPCMGFCLPHSPAGCWLRVRGVSWR